MTDYKSYTTTTNSDSTSTTDTSASIYDSLYRTAATMLETWDILADYSNYNYSLLMYKGWITTAEYWHELFIELVNKKWYPVLYAFIITPWNKTIKSTNKKKLIHCRMRLK